MRTLKFTFDNLLFALLIAALSLPLLALGEVPLEQKTANQKMGFIEGSLSYPSEFIPEDLKVCAETLDHTFVKCTSEHLKNSKYVYGEGFILGLPEGDYYIYAQSDYLDQLNNAQYRGYYTDFIVCGQGSGCDSHKPVVVHVITGKAVQGIMPADWQLHE